MIPGHNTINMKVKFIQSPAALNLAYFEGDEAELSKELAEKAIELKIAIPLRQGESALPNAAETSVVKPGEKRSKKNS